MLITFCEGVTCCKHWWSIQVQRFMQHKVNHNINRHPSKPTFKIQHEEIPRHISIIQYLTQDNNEISHHSNLSTHITHFFTCSSCRLPDWSIEPLDCIVLLVLNFSFMTQLMPPVNPGVPILTDKNLFDCLLHNCWCIKWWSFVKCTFRILINHHWNLR